MSHLRVRAREEKYFGYPATERRVGLLDPRKDCTDATQRQCNSQWTDEEAATQVIHGLAKQQSEPSGHSFTLPNEVSDGIPIFDPRFRQAQLWKTSLDEETSAQPLAPSTRPDLQKVVYLRTRTHSCFVAGEDLCGSIVVFLRRVLAFHVA